MSFDNIAAPFKQPHLNTENKSLKKDEERIKQSRKNISKYIYIYNKQREND